MQAIKTTSFHFLVSPSNRFKAAQSQSRKSVNSLKVFSFHSSCSIDVLITSEALSVLWLPTHSLYLLIFSSAHLIANNYYSNTPIALNGVVCLPNDLEFGRILFWFFVVEGVRFVRGTTGVLWRKQGEEAKTWENHRSPIEIRTGTNELMSKPTLNT